MTGKQDIGKKKITCNTDATQEENIEILIQIPPPRFKLKRSFMFTEEQKPEIVEWVHANDCCMTNVCGRIKTPIKNKRSGVIKQQT